MVEQIDMFAESSKNGGNNRSGYDADDIRARRPCCGAQTARHVHREHKLVRLASSLWEIVDNAVDEHLAKYCSRIEITLHKDGSATVYDNGRGIPTGMHKTGIPTPQVVFTILHAGGKFGGSGYKKSGGLHGVGASVTNALSEWLEVEIYRDGKIHRQRFEYWQDKRKRACRGTCNGS